MTIRTGAIESQAEAQALAPVQGAPEISTDRAGSASPQAMAQMLNLGASQRLLESWGPVTLTDNEAAARAVGSDARPSLPTGFNEGVRVSGVDGRVTEAVAPNGASARYAYDAAGNVRYIEATQGGNGLTLARGENGEWARTEFVSGPFGLRFQTYSGTVSDVSADKDGFSYRDGNATIFRGHNGHLRETREVNGANTVTDVSPNGTRQVESTGAGGSVRQVFGPDGQIHEVARNSNDGTSEKLKRDANGRWTREFGLNGDPNQMLEQLHDVQFDTASGSSYTYRVGGPQGPLVRQHMNGNREIDYGGGLIRNEFTPEGQLQVSHTNPHGERETFRNEGGTWVRETFAPNGVRTGRIELSSFDADPMGGLRYSHDNRTTTLRRNGLREDVDVSDDRTTTVTRESSGDVRSIYLRTADGREEDLRLDAGTPAPGPGQPDNRWSLAGQASGTRDRVTDFQFDPLTGVYSYTRNGQRVINGSPEVIESGG